MKIKIVIPSSYITLYSSGGASEEVSHWLGQYAYDPNQKCYKQSCSRCDRYIFHVERYGWFAGAYPGKPFGFLKNEHDDVQVPTSGWMYKSRNKGNDGDGN